MIDLLLLAILAIVTWCVASEGLVGAVQICLIVIFSGLIAMNFFEPLAGVIEGALPGDYAVWADLVSLVGLFGGLVFLLRTLTERVGPGFPDAPKLVYEGGRWFASFLCGYVTMAFLCTAIHTAPVSRDFWGFTPERANLFGFSSPDRQWLGFTQYASEKSLKKWGTPNIFDGPKESLGGNRQPYANDTWASFPIRYATRRERSDVASAAASVPGGGIRVRGEDTGGTGQPSPRTSGGGSNAPSGF